MLQAIHHNSEILKNNLLEKTRLNIYSLFTPKQNPKLTCFASILFKDNQSDKILKLKLPELLNIFPCKL